MRRFKFLLNLVTSLVFITVIFGPATAMLATPDEEISEAEQRALTQLPENINPFNQPFKEFVTNIEAYVNDQFGYRDRLIYWHNYLKVVGMHKSPTDKVIIGKNKWLFFTRPNQIEDHQGLSEFSEEDLARWANLLNYRHRWFAERGIVYVFVIAPDKKTIYPEYFPSQYPIIYENNTQLDQFMAYMAEHSEAWIIDLREPILAYKENNPDGTLLYYSTDTHWTHPAAFVGYQTMMTEIQKVLPDVNIVSPDLLRTNPFPVGLQDNLTIMHMENLAEFLENDYVTLGYATSSLICRRFVDYQLPPYYRAENTSQTECVDNKLNAIIFHDSFGFAVKLFWSESFKTSVFYHKVVVYWEINDNFEAVVDEVQPAIVIDEMVERNLIIVPPPVQ